MRSDAISLEASRMSNLTIENYPWIHERHRAFPQVFETRKHSRIIDLAAGIGIIAKTIKESYDCDLVCNEIDPNCLRQLKSLGVMVTSFDLDSKDRLPIRSNAFDAVLSLVTLEHIINTENLICEMYRIMTEHGRLYLSVPNYSSIFYLIPLLRGRTFHDPLDKEGRYEFYGHVRYFTYYTVIELFESFGLYIDTVYLTLPKASARYQRLRQNSRVKAFLFRVGAKVAYSMSPRWHPGPIMCFSKIKLDRKPRIIKI